MTDANASRFLRIRSGLMTRTPRRDLLAG
jgi:hypothetical protein